MSLIAILLSLFFERFLGSMAELRRFRWFLAYSHYLVERLRGWPYLNGSAIVVLVLAPPLIMTWLINYYLGNLGLLFVLVFAVMVLLLSFGPSDLEAEVEAYIDACERDDKESARWHAAELIGDPVPELSAALTRRLMESTLVQANERLLAVVFWFVLLGPVGALLFRLSQLLIIAERNDEDEVTEAAVRLHHILTWLPSRLCALAYALAGSFVEAMHAWRNEHTGWPESNQRTLIAAGIGALRFNPEELEEENQAQHIDMVSETLSLVRRAVLVFISLIALFTLAGWMA